MAIFKKLTIGGVDPTKLQDKVITENGEYTPEDGYDGFQNVTVNVETEDTDYCGAYKSATSTPYNKEIDAYEGAYE